MSKITTFLWFDDQAEEASDRHQPLWRFGTWTEREGHDGELRARRPAFTALNGGPQFRFTSTASPWQVVPRALSQLLKQTDGQTSQRVMQAMLQMQKIDISALESASAT